MNSTAGWRFQILNFPVRVHVSFFLVALLLGLMGLGVTRPIELVLWVVIVFISILVHELGHAVVADFYGRSPQIELYSMGGLTIPTRYSLLSYPKEIFISFAGPLAGFLLGALMYAILRLVGHFPSEYLYFFVIEMVYVNIFWGIVNLVPILPLDGGNIMRNLYHWLRNPYDERTPLIISVVFGVLAVIAALVYRQFYIALLAAWMTMNNFMALRRGYWTDNFI